MLEFAISVQIIKILIHVSIQVNVHGMQIKHVQTFSNLK